MRHITITGLSVFLLLIAGCSSLPGLTPRQSAWLVGDLAVDDPGPQMQEFRFRGAVRQWLHANGTDPDQCRFDWDRGPGWYQSERYGVAVWMRGVHVNAKDRTGRYVGYEPYVFAVRGGRVVDIIGASVTPLTTR